MRVALDTNRYSDLMGGDVELATALERASTLCLPFIVLGELRSGFGIGRRTERNEAQLSRFLALPDVRVLHSDNDTTRHYASLYRQMRSQGTPIPTNDLWIAALVVQHDLALCSRDEHFDELPQLVRV